MMLVPSASVRSVVICGCISVGNPGWGIVLTLVRTSGPSTQTRMLSSNSSMFTPIFRILLVIGSRCLGITLVTIKVPASIWSGMTE